MSKKENVKRNQNLFGWFTGIPAVSMENLCKLDWIISLLVLAFLFVSFAEVDIILTGNRSFLYYRGLFKDFYKMSYEQSHGFYANYLPPTFLAFAIWNLPLFLMGRVPVNTTQSVLLNVMWYKLLPVILYFITAHLIEMVALELDFGKKKAKLCKFAFLVCPIGVYSQFIFSQYDIFVVFFIVLGLYLYFKDKLLWSALIFGVGATFKYQALAYFAVLLVLKEKKFRNWILYGAAAVLPLAVCFAPYLNSPYFYRCVRDFGVLGYVDNSLHIGFVSGINLMFAMAAFLLAWAYIKKAGGREELISWALFFGTGISFALFGFAGWNPQWFIITVPFFILAAMRNQNGKFMILLSGIFIAALYIFTVNNWKGIVDQAMFRNGIFKYIANKGTFATSMADVYGYNDTVMLGTCIFVILLVFFVFNHPRFQTVTGNQAQKYMINYVRVVFLGGVAAFVLPAFVCLAAQARGETLFFDNTRYEAPDCEAMWVTNESVIHQKFYADGDEIRKISVRLGMYGRINDSTMYVRILDGETQDVIYENELPTIGMVKEETMHTIVDGHIPVEKGKMYILELEGKDGPDNCVAIYYHEIEGDRKAKKESADIEKTEQPVQIVMKIRGIRSEEE